MTAEGKRGGKGNKMLEKGQKAQLTDGPQKKIFLSSP